MLQKAKRNWEGKEISHVHHVVAADVDANRLAAMAGGKELSRQQPGNRSPRV
jgi:hypothetical protein